MEFEWDDAKSEACFLERGFDFEYAAQTFFDPHRRVTPDTRRAYGEDRFQLLGQIDGRVLMDAVRCCSLGQITNALFEVGGQYRRSM